MSSTVLAPTEPTTVVPLAKALGAKFRLIPRFETDPRVVEFSQTVAGKLLLLAIFGLTLSVVDGNKWWLKVTLLAAAAFLPKARRLLVTIGTVLFMDFLWFDRSNLTRVITGTALPTHAQEIIWIVLPFVLLCAALMWLAGKYSKSLIARRPLFSLLGICGMLLAVARYAPLPEFPRYAVWALLLTLCSYFWYLVYALSDCATPRGDRVLYQFGTVHAFWGSTGVPLPKGSAYWRRIEAKTPEDLAVTMIKGVKLMIWCFLLYLVKSYYMVWVYQRLGVPQTGDCLTAFLAGKPLSFAMNWLSWPAYFLADLLTISIWGHAVIATCRMAGFRALRNTYAPLSSRTIAEYWNRYYYYFKELLVDMFFYPTFIRCFKRHSKVRIFFATFVAASLGNTLFHFILHPFVVLNVGLLKGVLSYRGYLVYSVLLALGISISQIRSRRHADRGWFRERLVAPACVICFYCLLHVFEVASTGNAIRYLAYLLSGR